MYSSANRYMGCFHFLTIVDNAAMSQVLRGENPKGFVLRILSVGVREWERVPLAYHPSSYSLTRACLLSPLLSVTVNPCILLS